MEGPFVAIDDVIASFRGVSYGGASRRHVELALEGGVADPSTDALSALSNHPALVIRWYDRNVRTAVRGRRRAVPFAPICLR